MKNFTLSLFTALALGGTLFISAASANPTPALPKLITYPLQEVFVPPGFDNNDNAQVILHGELPSTCFKVAAPAVRVDHTTRRVFVAAQAYQYSGTYCLQVGGDQHLAFCVQA